MKPVVIGVMVAVSLAACAVPPTMPAQTTAINTAAVPLAASSTLTATPAQTTSGNAVEEAEVRDLVENFGKRLQAVSLQAADAAQEIQEQYSEFVSPALLEMWVNAVSKAPGRIVSSPWPDRIEIIALLKEDPGRYEITGFVVEMTSLEVVNGGAAARIPVRMVAQKDRGRWLITEYAQEQ